MISKSEFLAAEVAILTEHCEGVISIKFLLVISMLYKTVSGKLRTRSQKTDEFD